MSKVKLLTTVKNTNFTIRCVFKPGDKVLIKETKISATVNSITMGQNQIKPNYKIYYWLEGCLIDNVVVEEDEIELIT